MSRPNKKHAEKASAAGTSYDASADLRGWEDVRECIDEMSKLMLFKLHANQHKGNREGWIGDDPLALLARVREEVDELEEALLTGAHPQDIALEAADVCNMAMMVADVAGGGLLKGGK